MLEHPSDLLSYIRDRNNQWLSGSLGCDRLEHLAYHLVDFLASTRNNWNAKFSMQEFGDFYRYKDSWPHMVSHTHENATRPCLFVSLLRDEGIDSGTSQHVYSMSAEFIRSVTKGLYTDNSISEDNVALVCRKMLYLRAARHIPNLRLSNVLVEHVRTNGSRRSYLTLQQLREMHGWGFFKALILGKEVVVYYEELNMYADALNAASDTDCETVGVLYSPNRTLGTVIANITVSTERAKHKDANLLADVLSQMVLGVYLAEKDNE